MRLKIEKAIYPPPLRALDESWISIGHQTMPLMNQSVSPVSHQRYFCIRVGRDLTQHIPNIDYDGTSLSREWCKHVTHGKARMTLSSRTNLKTILSIALK
jgi:hypothetical protein